MSIKADDKQGEAQKKDLAEQQVEYLKVIAFVLCEMHGLDLDQILNDMRVR